jgi:sulfate permease, SulP family
MPQLQPSHGTSDHDSFMPQSVTAFRAGYSFGSFKADAVAGMTVAIVALPLSMAIAIASGALPAQGLITAIAGGFIISLLGGSLYQIGGPAGAFIVLVASTIERVGYGGFLTATLIAGILLLVIGVLRLGSLIKFIPHSVIVGFSAGIAVIIGASQIKDFFGLQIAHEPAAFLPKLAAVWDARSSFSALASAMAVTSVALIIFLRIYRPRWPAFLIVVVLTALVAWLFHMPVETIGTHFGGIPSSLPVPQLPDLGFDTFQSVLPAALTIALLGGIESLLSAVVADSMTGTRHRPNAEIIAQGMANIATALFGGICATGTIARTATNIRARAVSPASGMFHSLFVLLFILLAAPAASYIPLPALAAILMVVVWNMADKHEFIAILRHDKLEALVLLTTCLLTIFIDLPSGIGAGVMLGSLIFMYRSSLNTYVDLSRLNEAKPTIGLNGAFFTGTAASIAEELALIIPHTPDFIILMNHVIFIDASFAPVLTTFILRAKRLGSTVHIIDAPKSIQRILINNGLSSNLFDTSV